MELESHSRQTLGEDVRRLILTCDLIEFHLRLVPRSKLLDSMDASVDMLGVRIHATSFDEKDTYILILRYEVRRRLLIS